jgi:two-component system phosphate regulon response regulator PhoB
VSTSPNIPESDSLATGARQGAKILVIDDEPDFVSLMEFNLRQAGFDVLTSSDGWQALRLARDQRPDLILMDVMLPELDGMELCQILRSEPSTATSLIIMVTARASEGDRAMGLQTGANDYITKPFSPRELLVKIQRLLETKQRPTEKPSVYHFDALTVDLEFHQARVTGERVDLTPLEFKILATLVENKGRIYTPEQLFAEVYRGHEYLDSERLKSHVQDLRLKLRAAGKYIDVVGETGFRFADQ